jgi:hypothetical protein
MQCNVEFGYQLSICSDIKETTEKLDPVGRSQDFLDASTNRVLSFDKTRTAQKTKKLGSHS